MPRGRKKADVPMLDFYTNELNRLTMLEKEQMANLEVCRAEIKKYKDLILQEEMKELKSIMNANDISFEEVKRLLESHSADTDNDD